MAQGQMMGLELLAALIPAAGDVVKGLVHRFLGTSQPQVTTPDEWVQVRDADTRRLEALANLDKPAANISPWVANLRASSRYILALAVVAAYITSEFIGLDSSGLQSIAGAGTFFLLGERGYMKLKGAKL